MSGSDRLDLEVESYETENERLEILDEIIKDPETFRVGRVGNIIDGANFGSL